MERKLQLLAVAAMSALIGAGAALAQDQDRNQLRTRDPDRLQTPDRGRTQDQDRLRTQDQVRDGDIYGYQLMTQQERDEYRARMRAAATQQERDRIRAEHHVQMQARAHERGVTLPEPPGMGGPEVPMPGPGPRGANGGRMGSGMGPGAPGGAMGGGMRR